MFYKKQYTITFFIGMETTSHVNVLEVTIVLKAFLFDSEIRLEYKTLFYHNGCVFEHLW